MSGSFQPIYGKLYSLIPAKVLVLTSLAIFMAGALLSALSSSSSIFILGRAITGLATAGVTSGAFAFVPPYLESCLQADTCPCSIIIQLTPLRSRSKYASIGAATEAVASLTAPMIGGVLVDRLNWSWCFYIELPFLAAAFVLVLVFFDLPAGGILGGLSFSTLLRKVEPYSTAVFIPAFTCLILTLQWGGSQYRWTDWRVLLPLALAVSLVLVYAVLQIRLGDRATMPTRILLRRSVLCGFLFAACNNGALSVIEYYLPTYFQTVQGASATTSGILMLPLGVGLIISVPLAGFLTYYVGYPNYFMVFNGLLTPVATGLLTTMNTKPATWKLLVYQALLGFGTGIGFQGPQVGVQAIFSDSDSQIGISIIQLAQALGPAIFVATAQTIFAGSLPSGFITGGLGQKTSGDLERNADASHTLGEDSNSSLIYAGALGRAFYVSLGLACMTLVASLGMEWHSVKRRSAKSGGL
ncbi:hypothetical protein LCI18_008788 [Fusarium solani-melongenae]|uniref:Uncharacterized protein n=1 Tax=Fusarium solani subsp. cucurbitae TaxID=2747967 RepID=A0ACD3Z9B7_FUSSC|nr:hypothetical protein LCI18_008788 [Fusarium solani-melongenae]